MLTVCQHIQFSAFSLFSAVVFKTFEELETLVGVLLFIFTFLSFVLVERINSFRADVFNIL